jgi:hypothetical protein
MVWVVIGNRTKTERVPDGARVERDCPACGEHATFHERRAVRTFRLYFLDVFDYDRQRVMACGACGTLFATDEHGAPSAPTAEGWRRALETAADRVGDAVSRAQEAARPAWQQATDNARELVADASEELRPWAARASEGVGAALGRLGQEVERGVRRLRDTELRDLVAPDESDDESDQEREDERLGGRDDDPEKAALRERFEELERELERKRRGGSSE